MQDTKQRDFVKGNLTQVPFPKAINFIYQAKKTGVLAIARGKKKVHIHFLNGEIVYVTSSYFPGYSLGDFLLKEGKISMQIHEEALAEVKGPGAKLGTHLVEKGRISPHDLYEILNQQVLAKLFWMFKWTDGDFFFKEGEIIDKEFHLLDFKIPKLIYQGLRDHMPLNSLPTEFKGRKESIMLRRPDVDFALDILGLGPIDTRILSFVNGRLTLRQIVAGARMKKRIIYKILYGLFLTGVIGFPESVMHERREPAKAEKAAAPKRPAEKGYEISTADDLIAQAMQSVDRIHQESMAQAEQEPAPEPVAPAPAAAPPVEEPAEEFGAKVDEMLQPEEQADIDEHFGFDGDSEDGFAQEEAEEDGTLQELAVGSEEVSQADEEVLPQDDAFMQGEDMAFQLDEVEPAQFDMGMGEEEEDLDDDGADYNLNIDDFTNPDEIFNQGVSLVQEGYFDDAVEFLNRALEMTPENYEIHAHLGWAIYMSQEQSGDNLQRAESMIKEGMRSGGTSYLHFLYLGKIYASENQPEFAELHFVKALELNIDCAEAREQIKLIHSR